jgi:hypothetical protein
MTILHLLRKHQLVLQIERVGIPSERKPEKVNGFLRVRIIDEAVTPAQTHEHLLEGYLAPDSLERIVAIAMRKVLPRHPAFRDWLDSKGNVRVDIADTSIEYCGEALHTAMRKLCDSPQSSLQWNAVHHMHPDDWSTLLAKTRELLIKLKAESKNGQPLRRDVGLALKELWREAPGELYGTYRSGRTAEGKKAHARTDLEKFALLTMAQSCACTEDDEFTWGWTGYLCTEATEPAPAQAENVESAG